MYCMKCGKETAESSVFCESCLQTMQAYPVKPGTVVQLPRRESVEEEKRPASRRWAKQPKDQLRQLRGTIRLLAVMVAVLSILLCLTAVALFRTLDYGKTVQTIKEWGRNYTTIIGD